MMSFEVVEVKYGWTKPKSSLGAFSKSHLSLGSLLGEKVRGVRRVDILYDKKNNLIALRPRNTKGGSVLSSNASRNSECRSVSIRGTLNTIGRRDLIGRKFQGTFTSGMIVIDLNQEVG